MPMVGTPRKGKGKGPGGMTAGKPGTHGAGKVAYAPAGGEHALDTLDLAGDAWRTPAERAALHFQRTQMRQLGITVILVSTIMAVAFVHAHVAPAALEGDLSRPIMYFAPIILLLVGLYTISKKYQDVLEYFPKLSATGLSRLIAFLWYLVILVYQLGQFLTFPAVHSAHSSSSSVVWIFMLMSAFGGHTRGTLIVTLVMTASSKWLFDLAYWMVYRDITYFGLAIDMVIVGVVAAVTCGISFYFFKQMSEAVEKEYEARETTKKEKDRVDRIVSSILPQHISEALRTMDPAADKSKLAEEHASVSIMFILLKNFSELEHMFDAPKLLEILNEVYDLIDLIVQEHNVYKVENVGPTVVLIAGTPAGTATNHTEAMANVGLDILEEMESYDEAPIKFQIGIHTGGVNTGVVGTSTLNWCVFGDTMNTSSRMMGKGAVNRVHVSNKAAAVLKKTGKFFLESRGEIPVKGLGMMETFWCMRPDDSNPEYLQQQQQQMLGSSGGSLMGSGMMLGSSSQNQLLGSGIMRSTSVASVGSSAGSVDGVRSTRVSTRRSLRSARAVSARTKKAAEESAAKLPSHGVTMKPVTQAFVGKPEAEDFETLFQQQQRERKFEPWKKITRFATVLIYVLAGARIAGDGFLFEPILWIVDAVAIWTPWLIVSHIRGLLPYRDYYQNFFAVAHYIVTAMMFWAEIVIVNNPRPGAGMPNAYVWSLGMEVTIYAHIASGVFMDVHRFVLFGIWGLSVVEITLSAIFIGFPVSPGYFVIRAATLFSLYLASYILYYNIQRNDRRQFLHSLDMQDQKEKSRDLLLTLLPKNVALRMIEHPDVPVVDDFDKAVCLQSDIAGFTSMSHQLRPDQILFILNRMFNAFDALLAKHNVLKCYTIGDAYIITAGKGVLGTAEDGVAACVAFGIDMQRVLREVNEMNERDNLPTLIIRVGVAAGPMIGGVVGIENKPKYLLFKDAPDVAEKMEQECVFKGVHVEKETWKELVASGKDKDMTQGHQVWIEDHDGSATILADDYYQEKLRADAAAKQAETIPSPVIVTKEEPAAMEEPAGNEENANADPGAGVVADDDDEKKAEEEQQATTTATEKAPLPNSVQ